MYGSGQMMERSTVPLLRRGGGTVLKPFTLEGGKKDQLPVACINMVTCTYQLLLIRNLGGKPVCPLSVVW